MAGAGLTQMEGLAVDVAGAFTGQEDEQWRASPRIRFRTGPLDLLGEPLCRCAPLFAADVEVTSLRHPACHISSLPGRIQDHHSSICE